MQYLPPFVSEGSSKLILKRCTRLWSKPRSYEETMRCRFDPAPAPMPAEATHLAPPCCVSTHRSRAVDPDGPPTFLDHREGRNEMDPPLCGSTAMSHNEFRSSEPIEPQEARPMQHDMHVLGIDIAKRVFHAVGMDDRGTIVYRKRWSRHDLIPYIAKLPPVRIGLEACGGAHYWARRFRAHGHEVQRMAPQFVKP